MIKEGNVYEVNNLYENSFPKLTDQYFKTSPWPEAEDIAPYVSDDPIFLNLYRELYFRHIYVSREARLSIRGKINHRRKAQRQT